MDASALCRGRLPATPLRFHQAPISSTRLSSYPTKCAYSSTLRFLPSRSQRTPLIPSLPDEGDRQRQTSCRQPRRLPPIRNADGNAWRNGNLLCCYLMLYSTTSRVSDSRLPSPETFEDALDNFCIALHPQTQHCMKYSWMEA